MSFRYDLFTKFFSRGKRWNSGYKMKVKDKENREINYRPKIENGLNKTRLPLMNGGQAIRYVACANLVVDVMCAMV